MLEFKILSEFLLSIFASLALFAFSLFSILLSIYFSFGVRFKVVGLGIGRLVTGMIFFWSWKGGCYYFGEFEYCCYYYINRNGDEICFKDELILGEIILDLYDGNILGSSFSAGFVCGSIIFTSFYSVFFEFNSFKSFIYSFIWLLI